MADSWSTSTPGRQARIAGADDYLAQWKWSEEEEREGSAQEVAEALKAELEAKGLVGNFSPNGRHPHHQRTIDSRHKPSRRSSTTLKPGHRRAHFLPQAGQVQRVHGRGGRGHGAALAADRAGASSEGQFPPLLPDVRHRCRAGHVRCHTMRRGHMRIERQALRTAASDGQASSSIRP